MSSNLDCDALVAGAGPAGSMAALTLSRAGWKVIVLEKKAFPRPKPCGGCLSRRAERLLPQEFLTEVAEGLISRVVFTFGERGAWEYSSPRPAAYMVRREVFDLRLAGEAEKAGASFRFESPLSGFQSLPDHMEVQTAGGTLRSRFLVLARGAAGIRAGQPLRRTKSLTYQALEGRLHQSRLAAPWPKDTVAIHLRSARFGYGWTFPCGDTLSVGFSFWPRKEKNARRSQKKFHQRLSPLGPLPRMKGHLIPCYDRMPTAYSDGRILRAGDEARLVEPFLGEGIYYALLSGQFGGETVSRALRTGRSDLTAYDRAIAERILPEFDFALRLARIIYCWPGLFWWLLKRHPGIMSIYFSILQGQESYGRFFWELKKRVRRITGLYHILGEPPRPAVL